MLGTIVLCGQIGLSTGPLGNRKTTLEFILPSPAAFLFLKRDREGCLQIVSHPSAMNNQFPFSPVVVLYTEVVNHGMSGKRTTLAVRIAVNIKFFVNF